MIVLKNVDKSYEQGFWSRKIKVLHDLSLEISKGEIFGFLGHNGAGKTTTIKLMLNLLRPDNGTITINGIPASNPLSRQNIGYLPDQPYFYDYLTAAEFLHFSAKLYTTKPEAQVSRLLTLVGLGSSAGTQLRKFSRGMLQRLGFAQALISDPDILILDEPMTGLDPSGRYEMRELMLKLRNEGKTIFFSSHILSDAEMICDRVGIITNGRLVNIGKLNELISEQVQSVLIESEFETLADIKKAGAEFDNGLVQDNKLFISLTEPADVSAALTKIQSNNGKIISVLPRRQTLEDLFLKSTEYHATKSDHI